MQRSDEVTLMNWVGRFFETQCMSRITDEVVPLKTKLQGGALIMKHCVEASGLSLS